MTISFGISVENEKKCILKLLDPIYIYITLETKSLTNAILFPLKYSKVTHFI